jgi:hypothetical protein
MTQSFKTWLAGFVTTATFVTVSFHWFDRPVALLIYNIFGGWRVSAELAARISKIPLAAAIVFVLCGLVALTGRPFSRRWAAVAMSAVSLMATIIIKDQLKFAFGRTWPDTWRPGIVSRLWLPLLSTRKFFRVISIRSCGGNRRCAVGCVDFIPGAPRHLRNRYYRSGPRTRSS